MFRILIIEDDEKLSILMKEYLEKYHHQVYLIEDFNHIEEDFQQINPHLVILDINLPYYDGFYLCRVFRRKSKVPIVIISARSGEVEQIMGIELGADDYITKPFSREILGARIKAVLRRTYGAFSVEKQERLQLGELTLDDSRLSITYNQQEVELSKNEYKLIKKLIENPNRIVSREVLLEELWDDSHFVDDNTLTVNVTRVKNRFREVGIKACIKTKRGVGYLFDTKALEGKADE